MRQPERFWANIWGAFGLGALAGYAAAAAMYSGDWTLWLTSGMLIFFLVVAS